MDLINNILFNPYSQWSYIIRISLACICGFAIGLERGRRQKDAGIRTHIIVAIGATLMMIVSKYGFYDVLSIEGISLDASRLGSNIITGISFLGAGVIFIKNVSIKGLTTAAGIWATAGVGIAIGAGMYILGIFTTALMIVIQIILHKSWLNLEMNNFHQMKVVALNTPDFSEKFLANLKKLNIKIHMFNIKKSDDGTIKIEISFKSKKNVTFNNFLNLVNQIPEIRSIDM